MEVQNFDLCIFTTAFRELERNFQSIISDAETGNTLSQAACYGFGTFCVKLYCQAQWC